VMRNDRLRIRQVMSPTTCRSEALARQADRIARTLEAGVARC